MTHELFIAHPFYSSWSLRGWLMAEKFGLPLTIRCVDIYDGGKERDLADLAPARTVPILRLADGTVVADSLAIAETLHELFPEAGLWPSDPSVRATARGITAEMHSGFTALRGACPMVLSHAMADFPVNDAVRADLARLETLWALGTADGPWLFGAYSVADAFYAPVAMRIAGYGLPVSDAARAYVNRHLSDPAIVKWRAWASDPQWALSHEPYSGQPGTRAPWPDAI